MRNLLILPILTFSSCIFLHGQTNPSSPCPKISVDGPAGIVAPGEIATFSARIINIGRSKDLKYSWSSSAGEIIKGQGTTTISVRQPTLEITVTVEIKGLPDGCPNLTSETENWGDRPPQALKLGETSDLRSISAGALLERVVQVIKDNPNAQLFILSGHIGDNASPDVSIKEQELLRDLSDKGIDKSQISMTGILAEVELFQFWLVPPGADPPRCKECEEMEKATKAPLCPTLSISGPEGIIKPGTKVRFKAVLSATDSQNLTYEWSINKGKIVNGQSTREISLDTSDIPEVFGPTTAELIVNVRIGGFPKGCEAKVSDKYFVSTGIYDVFPIDEYGAISIDDEKARLDNLATQLSNNPYMKGYIVKSFPKGTSDRATVLRVNRIKKFLFVYGKYPKDRYEILVCQSKAVETNLWLWPVNDTFQPGNEDCKIY